jgi:hypothetical protein
MAYGWVCKHENSMCDAEQRNLCVMRITPKKEKGRYEESSPALAKMCADSGVLESGEAKLCCVLPVLQDPDWVFTLYSRRHDEEQMREHPGWWQRQEKVVE